MAEKKGSKPATDSGAVTERDPNAGGAGARNRSAPAKAGGARRKSAEPTELAPRGRDERIRERAHEIWEQEGRSEGREREHWEQAEREEQ